MKMFNYFNYKSFLNFLVIARFMPYLKYKNSFQGVIKKGIPLRIIKKNCLISNLSIEYPLQDFKLSKFKNLRILELNLINNPYLNNSIITISNPCIKELSIVSDYNLTHQNTLQVNITKKFKILMFK